MIRNTATMRHEHLEFLLCSFKQELCFALRCPEMMHRDINPTAIKSIEPLINSVARCFFNSSTQCRQARMATKPVEFIILKPFAGFSPSYFDHDL